MGPELIILLSLLAVLLILLLSSFVCFMMIFYSPKRKKEEDDLELPNEPEYNEHRAQVRRWINEAGDLPFTSAEIKSHDGLTLRAKFYEYKKGAPIELMFHGYKGNAKRDLSGGIFRCFGAGHSTLVVDLRASGRSDGHVISFGINESRDCLLWIDYIINNIDKDAKIILTGVSMGAATVMITAGKPLPENVVGVLADCGYTSAKDIIKKVIRDMKLPADLLYPFAKIGAKIFGRFDLDETSPREMLKKTSLPIIFLHGDADTFVPSSMSEENFTSCTSENKKLVLIKGAVHGLAFPKDEERYVSEVREFFSYLE